MMTSYTLLERFWRISLHVTDDAIAKLYMCDVECSQMEGNGRKFCHIELRNSVISVLTVYRAGNSVHIAEFLNCIIYFKD